MDKCAFEEAYKSVYREMFYFALYTLGRRLDAEDAVSEAVADACQNKEKLRREESFKPWIFSILTIKCKRKLKEYTDQTVELNEEIFSQNKEEAWNVEEQQDVRNAFSKLGGQERMIISLSVFGGYNSQEIGKILFLKSATVRSKLARALNKMERELEG